MAPNAEANKKRPLLIDLNELPPPDPEDSPSGETDQGSLPPPPAAAGFKSGQGKESERQVDENGGGGEEEDEESERKVRKLGNDSEPWTAGDDGGGFHEGTVRVWEKWRAIIQTVAWELGEKKLVHWMDLMEQERQVTAGFTARNGPRPDEDKNASEEVVPDGAAPAVEIPAAASQEVVTRKSKRIRMLPSKFKDSFLL